MAKKIKSPAARQKDRPVVFPYGIGWNVYRIATDIDPREYLTQVLEWKLRKLVNLQTPVPDGLPTTRVVYIDKQDTKKCFQLSMILNKRLESFGYNNERGEFARVQVPWFPDAPKWLGEAHRNLVIFLQEEMRASLKELISRASGEMEKSDDSERTVEDRATGKYVQPDVSPDSQS